MYDYSEGDESATEYPAEAMVGVGYGHHVSQAQLIETVFCDRILVEESYVVVSFEGIILSQSRAHYGRGDHVGHRYLEGPGLLLDSPGIQEIRIEIEDPHVGIIIEAQTQSPRAD